MKKTTFNNIILRAIADGFETQDMLIIQKYNRILAKHVVIFRLGDPVQNVQLFGSSSEMEAWEYSRKCQTYLREFKLKKENLNESPNCQN